MPGARLAGASEQIRAFSLRASETNPGASTEIVLSFTGRYCARLAVRLLVLRRRLSTWAGVRPVALCGDSASAFAHLQFTVLHRGGPSLETQQVLSVVLDNLRRVVNAARPGGHLGRNHSLESPPVRGRFVVFAVVLVDDLATSEGEPRMAEERLPMYVPAGYLLADNWRNRFMQALARHHHKALTDLRDGVLPLFKRHNPYQLRTEESVVLSDDVRAAISGWRQAHNLQTTEPVQESDWLATRTMSTLKRFAGLSPGLLESHEGEARHGYAFCFQPSPSPALPFESSDIAFRMSDRWDWTSESPEQAADRIRRRFERKLRRWTRQVNTCVSKMVRIDQKQHRSKDTTHFMWLAQWQCNNDMSYTEVAKASRVWDQSTLAKLRAALSKRIELSERAQLLEVTDTLEVAELSARLKMRVVNLAANRGLPYNCPDELWDQLWESSIEQAKQALRTLEELEAELPNDSTVANGVKKAAEMIGIARRAKSKGGRPRKSVSALI